MMRKLEEGIYGDGDSLHLNLREMCQALGIPYTAYACQMIREETVAAFQQVFGRLPDHVVILETREEKVN